MTTRPIPLVEQAPFVMAEFSHPLPDDAPIFCPVCGRPLEYSYWDTVDGRSRYSSFVCFGGSRWAPFTRRFKVTYPVKGVHYRFDFGPNPVAGHPVAFDRHTGKPVAP